MIVINPNDGTCTIEGIVYPIVGFGTYPLKNETCIDAVKKALKLGYRIIDTATFYDNFNSIGKALKEIERKDIYIISKAWPDAQTSSKLHQDLEMTLEQLQTNYLDAYLLHWPNSRIPIEETMMAMEELRKEGLIRQIGMSNITVNHLKRVQQLGIALSWVQVEMNPLFCDFELLEFCHENDISIQAWAPLGRGRVSKDDLLTSFGNTHEKTASQIALKWIAQHDCVPLVGSKNSIHIQQNLEINDFTLSKEEMNEIDARAKVGKRERVTEEMGIGFTDEFDLSLEECWPIENDKKCYSF